VIKPEVEWNEYISSICKLYGFKFKHNPTAFTKEGRYIGGYEATVAELLQRYNFADIPLEDELEEAADPAQELTKLNIKIAAHEYDTKHRNQSLGEKLNEEFEHHWKKGDFNFHLEKFELIDIGDRNVVFSVDIGFRQVFATVHSSPCVEPDGGDRPEGSGGERDGILHPIGGEA
jgi:hypothetical protein